MDGMHLYKRGRVWWLRFRDQAGNTRRLRGASNRRVADGMARQIASLVEYASSGATVPEDLLEWLMTLDEERRGRLLEWGVVSERRMVSGEDLAEQLERWKQGLLNRGRGEKYASLRHVRAQRLIEAAGAKRVSELDAERVLDALEQWRRDGKVAGEDWVRTSDLSEQTLAHYLSAAKSFTRWMHRAGYAPRDPLAVLRVEKRAPKPDAVLSRQARRRALTTDEQRRLLAATVQAPKRHRMTGAERALLYRVALTTGLRAGAIRRLRAGDVDLERRVIRAVGSGAGNKRSSAKPIPAATAQALRTHLSALAASDPLFPMPSQYHMGEMVRADCEDATVSTEGVDFHALRHTFGTTLARQGIHPKTLMALMDHATIQMTMALYTHSFPEDESSAVEGLPDLDADAEAVKRTA